MPRSEQEYADLQEFALERLDAVSPEEFTPVAPQVVRLRNAAQEKEDAIRAADAAIHT